jgi:hypothetical protein
MKKYEIITLRRKRKFPKNEWFLDIFALLKSDRCLEIRKLIDLPIALRKR